MSAPVVAADVDELIRTFVRPGQHLHLSATPSRPNALLYALCRIFGREGRFTISTTAVHSSAHAIALSGCAERVIAGFVGDTYPSPRPNPLYARLTRGEPFTFEAWSLLSYTQRLMAGAMGQPYAVTTSLTGTDLGADRRGDFLEIDDPVGRRVGLVTALHPDLTLIHGVCADEDGNVVLAAPTGEGHWAALAATGGVLASVERIASREEVRALADRVLIPGQRVIGLAVAPLGAHPQGLRTGGLAGVDSYLDDYPFKKHVAEACRDPRTAAAWFREWVVEAGSHEGYLARLGTARCDGLRRPRPRPAREPYEGPATRQERLIVLGARAVADRVRADGYDTLLAGIGTSHIAAWLAAATLRASGHEVRVVSELGCYGVTPQDGDVYLFSVRHADASESLSSIPEILGGMVAGNRRALGVLAAAEIDQTGAINTSVSADGTWLTGSGGANDIASAADCLVIAPAGRRRYVAEVAYRTSPGHRVREVVSQFGRFRRDRPADPFHLASWLAEGADGESPAGAVAARTSWGGIAVDRAVDEKPITAEELGLLRSLDPEGIYR